VISCQEQTERHIAVVFALYDVFRWDWFPWGSQGIKFSHHKPPKTRYLGAFQAFRTQNMHSIGRYIFRTDKAINEIFGARFRRDKRNRKEYFFQKLGMTGIT